MNQATNLRSRPEEISRLHVGIVYQVMSIEAMEKSIIVVVFFLLGSALLFSRALDIFNISITSSIYHMT